MNNQEIARILDEVADILEIKGEKSRSSYSDCVTFTVKEIENTVDGVSEIKTEISEFKELWLR